MFTFKKLPQLTIMQSKEQMQLNKFSNFYITV